MPYVFDHLFAADEANPQNVARNSSVTIFLPGDATKTPVTGLKTVDGQPYPNPITTNANGYAAQPVHDTLDRLAWSSGGGFTGVMTAYEGMKEVAVAAQSAAEAAVAEAAAAGANAAAEAATALAGAVSDAEAAKAAAESAAALVGAPADSAIAAAVTGSGTATKAALNATYAPVSGSTNYPAKDDVIPKWKATTAYASGEKVVSPNGDIVSAKTAFTSGASYDAANWDLSATVAGKLDKTEAASTYTKKPARLYDLRDSAAVGDGVADDTAAIQAVITSMPANSRLVAERGKTYLVGELAVTGKSDLVIDGNGATFKLKATGSRIAAFSVGGTGTNLEFRNIRVKGNAVLADAHGGIVGQSTAVLSNITVADCIIEDVTLGISFSAEDVSSSLTGVIYRNNRLKNIVGTTSGNGYGLHISVANGNTVGAVIEGNVITSAQRHAIYCAKGIGFSIVDNVVLNHRSAIGDGSILPALMIARSTNVTITGNVVLKPKGGALYLGGPSGLTAGAYTVTGNVFTDPQDAPNLVYIGQDTPSVDGVPNGVTFTNNMLTAPTVHGLMTVYNGLNIIIMGNQFRTSGSGAATALTLTGSGTTGADYTDNITIAQNYFDLDAANPASKVAVRFSPGHDAHTTKYWFRGNRLIAGASMFTSSSTITNPNIAIADQVTTGISFAGGTNPVPWRMDGATATTAPAAGGGAALPATPAGYFTVNINGTNRQVAYY